MGMRLYKSIVAILILSVCFLCACGTDEKIQAPKMKPSQAAWSVYWDWANGIDEAQDDKYQDIEITYRL